MPQDTVRRRVPDFTTVAIAAISVATIAICAHRAAVQSISHDEAYAYQQSIVGSWRGAIFHRGVPNHVLLVLIVKALFVWLPANEFTMRLPGLLCLPVYCAAGAVLLDRFVARPWLRVGGFLLLVMNPYVIDYFSQARGYAPMLAFLLAATWRLIPPPGRRVTARHAIEGGLLLGLAMAWVPVAAFTVTGMLIAGVVFAARAGNWREGLQQATLAAAAGAALATPMLGPQLLRSQRGDYYFGAVTIPQWIAGLARAGWSHRSSGIQTLSELTPIEWLVGALAVAVFVASIVLALRSLRRWPQATDAERGLTWLAITMFVMAAFAVGAHYAVDLPYPSGRSAIYWIPPIVIAMVLIADRIAAVGRWHDVADLAIALMVLNTLRHAPAIRYADNWFDAANREAIAAIERDRPASKQPISIGASWMLEPGLNFYRTTRGLDWIAPVTRRPPERGDDYYVLMAKDAGFVDSLELRILFQDPDVGTIVAVPRSRSSRRRPASVAEEIRGDEAGDEAEGGGVGM